MEVLAKGQLSYMILSCLSERDMYGLELIDEIKERYGREIKLPSLYSNINRMKELRYISSYLKESTKGPKCSYSSITEIGRNALEELKLEFDGVDMSQPKEEEQAPKIEVSLQTNDFESALSAAYISPVSNEEQETEEEIETPDDYDDYFSFDDEEDANNELEEESVEEKAPIIAIQQKITDSDFEAEEAEEESLEETEEFDEIENIEEDQEDSVEEEQEEIEEEAQEENPEEKIAVISSQEAQEYNQKVYAAAKDFSKNKNKRSYSENQIELALSTSPARSEEATKQDLDELKSALLSSRQGYYEEVKVQPVLSAPVEAVPVAPAYQQPQQAYVAPQPQAPISPAPVAQAAPVVEERKDDGRFITDVLSEKDIPKPKRIEPARLNVTLPNTSTDKKLPAPKRNIAVDPTCSDVKAKLEKLYAKAEVVKSETPVYASSDFEDYADLKRYYLSQEVDFKVYERPEKRPKHNTNRLKLFVSLFVFGLVGLGSALMYLIFSLCGLTQASTNFVYYLFPILAAVLVVYNYYNYKTTVSKVPNKMWHPAIVWSIFAALIAIIFLINYVCGVPFTELNSYFSTILVPVFAAGCFTIGLYYAQLVAYKKWWK